MGCWLKRFGRAPRAPAYRPAGRARMRVLAGDLRRARSADASTRNIPGSAGKADLGILLPLPGRGSALTGELRFRFGEGTPCGAGRGPAAGAPLARPATCEASSQTDPVRVLPLEPPPAPEGWAYAVWAAPNAPSYVGVHTGGGRAWRGIEAALRGYSYRRGDRLRRYANEALAHDGFQQEARRHGLNPWEYKTIHWA